MWITTFLHTSTSIKIGIGTLSTIEINERHIYIIYIWLCHNGKSNALNWIQTTNYQFLSKIWHYIIWNKSWAQNMNFGYWMWFCHSSVALLWFVCGTSRHSTELQIWLLIVPMNCKCDKTDFPICSLSLSLVVVLALASPLIRWQTNGLFRILLRVVCVCSIHQIKPISTLHIISYIHIIHHK